jgi:hypothetical protein
MNFVDTERGVREFEPLGASENGHASAALTARQPKAAGERWQRAIGLALPGKTLGKLAKLAKLAHIHAARILRPLTPCSGAWVSDRICPYQFQAQA